MKSVSLPQFEGPLDLLLALVYKNKLSITDLPIAEITRQYLEYLRTADDLDLNLGADFTYTAATLIQIKSRSLLPADPALGEPDPRQELVRQLLDHEQLRRAAEFLQARMERSGHSVSSTVSGWEPDDESPEDEPMERPGSMNLLQVLRVAQRALETAKRHEQFEVATEPVTVSGMEQWISGFLAQVDRALPVAADLLFAEQQTLEQRNVLLLALLEMAKSQRLWLEQPELFATILLHVKEAGPAGETPTGPVPG